MFHLKLFTLYLQIFQLLFHNRLPTDILEFFNRIYLYKSNKPSLYRNIIFPFVAWFVIFITCRNELWGLILEWNAIITYYKISLLECFSSYVFFFNIVIDCRFDTVDSMFVFLFLANTIVLICYTTDALFCVILFIKFIYIIYIIYKPVIFTSIFITNNKFLLFQCEYSKWRIFLYFLTPFIWIKSICNHCVR